MAGDPSFYDLNPIQVIDQNHWKVYYPDVALVFRNPGVVYTPLIRWESDIQAAKTNEIVEFEMFAGDVVTNEIPLTANYVDTTYVPDTRFRKFTTTRYAGKVIYHKSSTYYNQWKINGGSDWRPLLRSMLGDHIMRSHEILSRNAFFKQPKNYWRYANGSDFSGLTSGKIFSLEEIDYWNFALGNTGSPIVPGTMANAKLAIIPPGAQYDIMKSLPTASANQTSLWVDAMVNRGEVLAGEIGSFKGVRFVTAPNDEFGINPNVLYNAGAITKQFGVTLPIEAGDGAPDPETTAVDTVWYVGQKGVTHWIQLEDIDPGEFEVNEWVTIHTARTTDYGITNGVDPLHPRTIVRKIVSIDTTNNRLSFDRPISNPYKSAFVGKSVTGNADGTFYAYVTKGKHIGFALILGSREGIRGKVLKPIEFYEPKPVDDFDSVWRFTYDELVGYNLAEPNHYLMYFFAVSLPKPGGLFAA